MKKSQRLHFTIQAGRSESYKDRVFLGFFCSFLLFFFAGASFLLNFSLIFSPDFPFIEMAELCMILGLGGALLFLFRKAKRFLLLLLGTLGVLLLFFYVFRKDFFRQFSSALGAVENQVKTLTDKLTNIDNTWNQRTAEMQQKVAQSDSVINGLKEENQKLKNELIVAQKKVDAASVQLDDKQRTIIMQWFMYGGGVLGLGLLLGLVLPHLIPSRKRKDRWMN